MGGSAGNHTSRHRSSLHTQHLNCAGASTSLSTVWARCPVPCALRTHPLHPLPEEHPPPQGSVLASPLIDHSSPDSSASRSLVWHKFPKPGPYSCCMFSGGGIRVGVKALMRGKAETHWVTITCAIGPLHRGPEQSGICLTLTSLRAEPGFSTSLFPLQNLTQSRCLIIP